ncbi:MAG: M23 family metallopeptidase, partial [Gaiellaceae bacterium]
MRPITFLAALVAALQLLSSSAVASGDWIWPVRGEVITPYRNGTDPYAAGQHRGIDIASPVGTAVVAATRGSVTFAGVAGSSGLTISIRTADNRFDTSYLHLSSASVHEGDSVSAGQRIGAVGTSGRRSAEQPHLHFGVREAGSRQSYRDPLDFLAPLPAPPRPQPAAAPRTAPAPVANHALNPLPAAAPMPVAAGAPP